MRTTVNTWIWGLGLSLEIALFAVLMVRGGARQMRFFAALIGFYGIRSALLFLVSGHISRATMGSLYDGLSLSDLCLQVLVLFDVVLPLLRRAGRGEAARGSVLLAASVLVSVAAGWAAGVVWPARGRVLIDRGQIALAVLFLLVFGWAVWMGIGGVRRRVIGGFAVYSAVSLVTQVERYRAALVRDAGTFAGWSYALAAVYLLVLCYWIWAMVWEAGRMGPREMGDVGDGRLRNASVKRYVFGRGRRLRGSTCERFG